MEFLKANGIEDHSFVKEMDYQEVLNSQEIFGDELAMFARKELQKEVCMSSYTIKENITNAMKKVKMPNLQLWVYILGCSSQGQRRDLGGCDC